MEYNLQTDLHAKSNWWYLKIIYFIKNLYQSNKYKLTKLIIKTL